MYNIRNAIFLRASFFLLSCYPVGGWNKCCTIGRHGHETIHEPIPSADTFSLAPLTPHSNVEVQLFFLPEGGWRRPHSNIAPRGKGGYSQHETTSRCYWRNCPLVQHFFLALRRNMLVPIDVHDAKAWAGTLLSQDARTGMSRAGESLGKPQSHLKTKTYLRRLAQHLMWKIHKTVKPT